MNKTLLMFVICLPSLFLTHPHSSRHHRRLHRSHRKLGVIGAVAGLGVGGLGSAYFFGPGTKKKEEVKTMEEDMVRLKDRYVEMATKRGAIINQIENTIRNCEERLRDLTFMSFSKIYGMNVKIKGANLKQIKAIKHYTAAVINSLEEYSYEDEERKKNK